VSGVRSIDRTQAGSRIVHVVLVASVLLLGACASVALRNPPRIDVVAVALDRVEGPDAYFTVDLALTNRADEPISIDALDASLSIEGEQVGEARLASGPVRLPAHGTGNAQLTAHSGMDAILRAVAAAMRRGATLLTPGARPTLHYALEGTALLQGGGRFPFSKRGELGERRP
jgi:LEA14-like dessication related protein